MSKMLKLLAFVEKSDTAKKIKGENNDAIKSMDARIKELLPDIIKKENEEHTREGSVNKLASERSRRRRYRETDSHYFEVGKGTRGPLGKTRTVYLPPEDEEKEERKRRIAELEKNLKDAEATLDKATEGAGSKVEELIGRPGLGDLEFMRELEKVTKDEPAAVMIQKIFRSWSTREAIKRKLVEEEEQNRRAREKIALKIQKRFRGNKARKDADDIRVERAREKIAALKIQKRFRGNKARSQVGEMRKAVDSNAERELIEMEEEAVDDPFSIPGNPAATYTELLNNKFKDSLTEQPLLSVKRTESSGDCLFEALVYFIIRVGDATRGDKGPPQGIWENPESRQRVNDILDRVEEYGVGNKEGLNLQIEIMRDYLAWAVANNWTVAQPLLNHNSYMTLLDKSAGGGGKFEGKQDYLIHMTSKNEEDARANLRSVLPEHSPTYSYKGNAERFGGVPELLEFQKLFNTKVQIIKGQKRRDTTELRFDGHPPGLFQVKENDIFDTKVMTLIYYSHSTNAKPPMAEPAPHYELIELTDAGEALAKSREEDLSLLEELDETEEGKRSSAAPAISSGERNIGDCVKYTYSDGGVVRGIIIRDRDGIKIKGLYLGGKNSGKNSGIEMFGAAAIDPGADRLEDWNPTGEELEHFFDYPERKKEKYNTKLQRVNRKIDGILNKFSAEAQDFINRQLTKIVELRFKVKSRLETKGRDDEQVKKMTQQQLKYKNLVKTRLRTKEPGKKKEVYDSQLDELVTGWTERTNIAKEWKEFKPEYQRIKAEIGQIRPQLEKCVAERRGGKRKRKTKRKRRKRKKKKSTRRKRRKR